MIGGVLDFLNGNGGAIIAIIVCLSGAYLFGLFKNETDRCTAEHPKHGRCRLKRLHWPRNKHVTWTGKTWYA